MILSAKFINPHSLSLVQKAPCEKIRFPHRPKLLDRTEHICSGTHVLRIQGNGAPSQVIHQKRQDVINMANFPSPKKQHQKKLARQLSEAMAPFSAYLVFAIFAVEAYCVPSFRNDRRQTSIPSFVNTYGKYPNTSNLLTSTSCAL